MYVVSVRMCTHQLLLNGLMGQRGKDDVVIIIMIISTHTLLSILNAGTCYLLGVCVCVTHFVRGQGGRFFGPSLIIANVTNPKIRATHT